LGGDGWGVSPTKGNLGGAGPRPPHSPSHVWGEWVAMLLEFVGGEVVLFWMCQDFILVLVRQGILRFQFAVVHIELQQELLS